MSSIVVAATVLSVGCGGGGPTGPSGPPGGVPVVIGFAGAPFSATIDGRTVSADGAFTFQMAPGDHEIAGTFSNGLLVIAFGGGAAGTGGVRSGSVRSLAGVNPSVEPCAVAWGDFTRRQQPFRARFAVTTDSFAACQ